MRTNTLGIILLVWSFFCAIHAFVFCTGCVCSENERFQRSRRDERVQPGQIVSPYLRSRWTRERTLYNRDDIDGLMWICLCRCLCVGVCALARSRI